MEVPYAHATLGQLSGATVTPSTGVDPVEVISVTTPYRLPVVLGMVGDGEGVDVVGGVGAVSAPPS